MPETWQYTFHCCLLKGRRPYLQFAVTMYAWRRAGGRCDRVLADRYRCLAGTTAGRRFAGLALIPEQRPRRWLVRITLLTGRTGHRTNKGDVLHSTPLETQINQAWSVVTEDEHGAKENDIERELFAYGVDRGWNQFTFSTVFTTAFKALVPN